MLHFKYIPLCSVTVRHTHYADGISPDFRFIPAEETTARLEASGLRLRNAAGRLYIYQQQDGAGVPVTPFDEAVDLFFVVRPVTDILNITRSFAGGRYWFSNLKENGGLDLMLTAAAELSAADELPELTPLRMGRSLEPGAYTGLVLQQRVAGEGWKAIATYPVSPEADSQLITVNEPGLYRLVAARAGGGTEETRSLMHEHLLRETPFFGVLHLHLRPEDLAGALPLEYTLPLAARTEEWQYLLIERSGGTAVNVNELELEVSTGNTRYPAALALGLKAPASFPESLKKLVQDIRGGPGVRDVFVFESDQPLEVLDGRQPQVDLQLNNTKLAESLAVPNRSMKERRILFFIKK
ncbi:MAG TPA: hypothetical protein VHK69_05010 [Chitinophagaceae bacterium]|jgi:hypothetical protein|nr:hypothetical protein [Chitinophagaceae bacterium]